MYRFTPLALLLTATSAAAEVTFTRHLLADEHKAEAAAVLDVNRDGRLDIVAGDTWYEAPDWKPHVLRDMLIEGGYADGRCDYAEDVNGDGWSDVLTVRRYGLIEWFENPQGRSGKWKTHKIGDATQTKGVVYGDVTGDGRGEFVGAVGGPEGPIAFWVRTDNPCAPWRKVLIGDKGGDLHGIGVGDINRDGRNDILTRWGWYEAPADPIEGEWTFHVMNRGMTHHAVVYDFDGDGFNDVAAGAPHDYGLYWWQQRRHHDDEPAWLRHTLDRSFSQLNTVVAADIDGDGDMDLVTGKRYYAHGGKDPGADEPALLVWYELKRTHHEIDFVRHVIDDDSGIGYAVTPCDIDGDGDIDIVSANKKGVFLFVQEGSPVWLPLFNGKDLSTFDGEMRHWSVEGGTIVGRTDTGLEQNTFLLSKAEYDNFVLTFDVKLTPDTANSGVQFRSKARDFNEVEGYQADIGAGWWGGIYEEHGRGLIWNGYAAGGALAVIPNAWNHYVVYAVGHELRVEINGTLCTWLIDRGAARGIIAPQIHSGGPTDVRFKGIRLRKMN